MVAAIEHEPEHARRRRRAAKHEWLLRSIAWHDAMQIAKIVSGGVQNLHFYVHPILSHALDVSLRCLRLSKRRPLRAAEARREPCPMPVQMSAHFLPQCMSAALRSRMPLVYQLLPQGVEKTITVSPDGVHLPRESTQLLPHVLLLLRRPPQGAFVLVLFCEELFDDLEWQMSD